MLRDYFANDLPEQYVVTVTYQGGIKEERRTNECMIDFRIQRNLRSITRKTLHDLVLKVEKLVGEIEKMRKSAN